MSKFIGGVVVGLFLGTATTVYGAGAAGPGASSNWTVAKDGEAMRSHPAVSISSSAIDRLS